MAVPGWLRRVLDHYGVPYEEHHHERTFSAARLAEAEHVSGRRVAKTVFLSAAGRPVAVVLPAHARLDPARVQGVLGKGELHLATEEEITGWFKGCAPGAVPPLRLRSDECVLMDRGLATVGRIYFAAGTHEDAVAMRFRDWYRTVRPGVGRFSTGTNGHAQEPSTVLVVEDEHATNEILCQLLKRRGFACCGAEAGSEALVLASEVKPAAILLDLMLPDMSGFEVYERLRRSGPIKSPPVIVVTALDDDRSRQRGRELGADAYLTKPFTAETLLAELNGALADATA